MQSNLRNKHLILIEVTIKLIYILISIISIAQIQKLSKSDQKLMSARIANSIQRIQQLERLQTANQAISRFLQLSLQLYFQWGFYSITVFKHIFSFLTKPKAKSQDHAMSLRFHIQSQQTDYSIGHGPYTQILLPFCLLWTFYNIMLILALKCINQLNIKGLLITGLINYLICIFIALFGFIQNANDLNPGIQIYQRYASFQIMNCLIVVTTFYFTKAEEPKRFSNSPGNFVWFWLFFAWDWRGAIGAYMRWIGFIYLIITLSSLLMLLLQLMKGLTTTVKRIIFIQWIMCLVLTFLTQIFAIFSHQILLNLNQPKENQIAINLLQIFMIVNILDMVFWIYGRCLS